MYRMIKKILLFAAVIAGLLLQNFNAQSQTQEGVPDAPDSPQKSESQISEYDLIHFGDLLEVDLIGSLEYDWRGTITPEGFLEGITLLEDPVYGLCQSPERVAAEISSAFAKFLRDPQIVVKILDRSARPTSVLYGAVIKQQRFQITRPVFLNELIIISGGLTDQASGDIQIFRPRNLSCLGSGDQQSVTANVEMRERYVKTRQDNGSQFMTIKISDLLSGKTEANPQIYSGDIITVMEARPIYVIGGVQHPTQISSRSTTTLSRAVSGAGGLSSDADETKIRIFRRELNETSVIEADLRKIKAGLAADITLEPLDIVEVARRGTKEKTSRPFLENPDSEQPNISDLPLRIID